MERGAASNSSGGLPELATGFHMPPEVLGEAEKSTNEPVPETKTHQHPLRDLNRKARKRAHEAVKATQSRAAISAAARNVEESQRVPVKDLDICMFTQLTYYGFDVTFGKASADCLVGFCSRTHLLLQTLSLASKAPVVSITSNSYSGLVIVAHKDGTVQTYYPVTTNDDSPTKENNESPTPSFGSYLWVDGATLDVGKVFYDRPQDVKFLDRRTAGPSHMVDISSSMNNRILVAHRSQLAVFDAQIPHQSTNAEVAPKSTTERLLWTTALTSSIRTAKLSGDGHAIAVAIDGQDSDGRFGAKTFIHDPEDGSRPSQSALGDAETNVPVGLVFREGPFLLHNQAVSRLSFRGLGCLTSTPSSADDTGNDLLMTTCADDSTVRVFNQHGWKQMMLWVAPPSSRADWIRGISSFNLGDLEAKKKSYSSSSRAPSRTPSMTSSTESGGINTVFRNTAVPTISAPSTAAGAWIAEISFRGAYPALRLSRLSYIMRGTDGPQPAHFESIAAILPPGSLVANSILESDDMGLSILGVWPAWDPWLSDSSNENVNKTLSGSAMQFLGLASTPSPTFQRFGESHSGGTYSPPTELRITAAHPVRGSLVIMEFPLWGDNDFGAMELGSPVRSVLALSSPHTKEVGVSKVQMESLECGSDMLCAIVGNDRSSVSIQLRKPGGYSISPCFENTLSTKAGLLLKDSCALAIPQALPSLQLPHATARTNEMQRINAIKWLPDESFDGPPLLLVVTNFGSLIVYEIPPPRSIHEPAMPELDPFGSSQNGSVEGLGGEQYFDDMSERKEYEVKVTPHPDFGLGLRLESPMDGFPAIAGSFKRHPLNGGMLPAERTGMIVLGDEVLSVNDVSLENKSFDDIIATVRQVGTETGPGKPLSLRFRPGTFASGRRNSLLPEEVSAPSEHDGSATRRPVIGVESTASNAAPPAGHDTESDSLDSIFIDEASRNQQEFGRIIGILPSLVSDDEDEDIAKRICILSWKKYVSSKESANARNSSLLVYASGTKVSAKKIQVASHGDSIQTYDLGCTTLESQSSSQQGVCSIQHVPGTMSGDVCFATINRDGSVFLVGVQVSESQDQRTGTFRHFRAFDLGLDDIGCTLKVESMLNFAAFEDTKATDKRSAVVHVWSARSDPSCRQPSSHSTLKDAYYGQHYVREEINLVPSASDKVDVTDIAFLKTGSLDSFPTLCVFLLREVVIFQKPSGTLEWTEIARVLFQDTPSSRRTPRSLCDPPLGIPHHAQPLTLPTLRSILRSTDEKSYLVSDWHPQYLLANLCTDDRGTRTVLSEHVQKTLLWLADFVDAATYDDAMSRSAPLQAVPFDSVGGSHLLERIKGENNSHNTENTASLVLTVNKREGARDATEGVKLDRLLEALQKYEKPTESADTVGKSIEFQLAMGLHKNLEKNHACDLPVALQALPLSELRLLWAIIWVTRNVPNFGKIDPQGQLALTIFALHKAIQMTPSSLSGDGQRKDASSKVSMKHYQSSWQKTTSMSRSDSRMPCQSASAGCVAAMASDFQGHLVDSIRQPGKKLDWKIVRELRVSFWLRSDDSLSQIAEEVGQSLYRESRDILEAAIFFLAAGKKRTLRNLAAADSSTSGKKFFKFLTGFDFSSERGRSAAEKNAFSLLRKNKYSSAAAFFLLAEPPNLRSAVETIAGKMGDHDLAFLVSRLVGNAQAELEKNGVPGGMAFGSVLGGGGGYAGSGFSSGEQKRDAVSFNSWKPKLSAGTKDLLRDRLVVNNQHDVTFTSTLYFWLGDKDESSHRLSGFIQSGDGLVPSFVRDVSLKRFMEVDFKAEKRSDSTIVKMNTFINFVTAPQLLKATNASARTHVASALLVAGSLAKMGVELPALRTLSQNAENSVFEGRVPAKNGKETSVNRTPAANPNSVAISSIFDSFDAPRPTPPKPPAAKTPASSIFDDFEVPQRTAPPKAPVPEKPASSIFDDFEVPQRTAPPKAPVPEKPASSIFDDFEVPRRTAPPKAPVEGSTSSIFDDFAPPPNAPKSTPSPVLPEQSSIFDSFAAAPSTRKAPASIFDSFDTQHGQADKTKFTGAPKPVTEEKVKRLQPLRDIPPIWREWRRHIFTTCASRRLLRELVALSARFHLDGYGWLSPFQVDAKRWRIPNISAQVLQVHADGITILEQVKKSLSTISATFEVDVDVLVDAALKQIEGESYNYRICTTVLLHLARDHIDLAEDVVRSTARVLIEMCNGFSLSNGSVASPTTSSFHVSRLPIKQVAAHLSWQLELCLWMHRGGMLPLGGVALNEMVCAVRIGLLLSAWNSDYEVLEAILKQAPDCLVDEDAGRQVWASLKMITMKTPIERKGAKSSSGGWEFLVDCKRAEATDMLRQRATGCFIIRPHPEDHGVFTLSFKTNLIPTASSDGTASPGGAGSETKKDRKENGSTPRAIKRDDVVQHAIVRLSDSGFRCGSFGPFATLMKLLEAVSSSLPFSLRFDRPPTEGVIKDEGTKPSPNAALFRKIGLLGGKRMTSHASELLGEQQDIIESAVNTKIGVMNDVTEKSSSISRERTYGMFIELLVLSAVRHQVSAIAAATHKRSSLDDDSESAISAGKMIVPEQEYTAASRMLRPFLAWCKLAETSVVRHVAPLLDGMSTQDLLHSEPAEQLCLDGGDTIIRRMIQPESGVRFRTLRLGDGGESAMVVLFSKSEAIHWIVNNQIESSEDEALKRLEDMETTRVIEPIDLELLMPQGSKKQRPENADDSGQDESDRPTRGVRYRLVDPWEVEPLESREAETRSACLGRSMFVSFDLGQVADSCQYVFRSIDSLSLFELWAAAKGGVAISKAIATVHPPWERASGGDLAYHNGEATETTSFENTIRQHLYRNMLYRQLSLPQRFVALIQVELLDLKNLTSPGGSLSLTVYSLLRLKRPRSTAPLTMKARTLDSVATQPVKLGKVSGPNAPASWGSLVRFRFAIPEGTAPDGRSYDSDREALFKGAPSVLQLNVYEKKFMSDSLLGGADVSLDGLLSGGQLEEWVPLRTESHGINWFARIRLTLRFELMCLYSSVADSDKAQEVAPSVGLRRIKELSNLGGVHEDIRKSSSTPDLLSYFESMVY